MNVFRISHIQWLMVVLRGPPGVAVFVDFSSSVAPLYTLPLLPLLLLMGLCNSFHSQSESVDVFFK